MDFSAHFHDRRTALCDCDNFFVSCERSVRPELEHVPVAVLSANDGCVVSRSNEVKAMGVKMGAPYYQVKNLLHAKGAAVFSGNMALYRDISRKVMSCLRDASDEVEQYSVDEAFFNMAIAAVEDPVSYCREIRELIRRKCGVPVSIGIAPTKTLCKLGAEYAKKHAETGGVFWLDKKFYGSADWMNSFETGDIWGIGYRTAKKLLDPHRVKTAFDLASCDDFWLKKNFGVGAMLTAWELRGNPASHTLVKHSAPQSIQVSRTFGLPVRDFADLLDPLLCFSVSAARQLRRSSQAARVMRIYIRTSCFTEERAAFGEECRFPHPEFLDSAFMAAAQMMLRKIFRPGFAYRKAGVYLSGFTDISACGQGVLFSDGDGCRARAAKAADTVNSVLGISSVKPAILFSPPGQEKLWRPKADHGDGAKPGHEQSAFDGMRFMSHAMDV